MSVEVASGQATPPPSIFFRTVNFIGAHTPGTSGHQVIVTQRMTQSNAYIEWMQLVPGPTRIFWNERAFLPPSTVVRTSWSAAADGTDVRPEPDLFGARIGSSGIWKYYFDDDADQFARSLLDGSGAQLLGFGSNVALERLPFIDEDEQWLYYLGAELAAPPSDPDRRLAILRGNISTAAVEEVLLSGRRFDTLLRYTMIFDPDHELIHLNGSGRFHDDFFPTPDSFLYQLDTSTNALIAFAGFQEGEGTIQQVALDPQNQDYYFTLPGGYTDPQALHRMSYADLGVQSPYSASVVLDADPAIGPILQLDSHPTIRVPEPGATQGGLIAFAMALLVRRGRKPIE
ncbi:MAG: hypothetical protein R3F21_09285 [Myxococcota bacterium]